MCRIIHESVAFNFDSAAANCAAEFVSEPTTYDSEHSFMSCPIRAQHSPASTFHSDSAVASMSAINEVLKAQLDIVATADYHRTKSGNLNGWVEAAVHSMRYAQEEGIRRQIKRT